MNIRPFEIGLIIVFAIGAVLSLFLISNYEPDNTAESDVLAGGIVIWGTLPQSAVDEAIRVVSSVNKAYEVVTYREIDKRSFGNTLVNAIAEGQSPDLVILPHNLLATYRSKIQPLSYEIFPARTFRDTYADGAEIFMLTDGVYGIPLAVDPLVMYWNRDLFSSAGLALPPATWESVVGESVPTLVKRNAAGTLAQSAIALGESANIAHAKDILSMLFLQSGNQIIRETAGQYEITLGFSGDASGDTAAALAFYAQFAMPSKVLYTWNSAQTLDRTEFTQGTLALYLGKGSERALIERQNANLNFDMALVPQGSGSTIKRTHGDWYAFVIPRAAKNPQGSYTVASALSAPNVAHSLTRALGFAPVHRATISGGTTDPDERILFDSALIARGWLDPSPDESLLVFNTMIMSARTETSRIKQILEDASDRLQNLF